MSSRTAVVLLGFGEPEGVDQEEVTGFLERIFLANAGLEDENPGGAEARARFLADARAPALTEIYRAIGGSPLMPQLQAKREGLEKELARRDLAIPVTLGTQFLTPSISDAVLWCQENEVERIVGLTTYPVCGRSTTVASLDELSREVEARQGFAQVVAVGGWHAHPDFAAIWETEIREYAQSAGVDLLEPGSLLYFSAHGTPLKYLERLPYTDYVEALCSAIANSLGSVKYVLGYQNHRNRPIPWVEPDNETLMPSLDADRVVVVPISFIQEQSETLSELDHDLSDLARSQGLDFYRVPVPHDSSALLELMADLVEAALASPGAELLRGCNCNPGAWCTNGGANES